LDRTLMPWMATPQNHTVHAALAVDDGYLFYTEHHGALTRVHFESGNSRTVLNRASHVRVVADGSLVAGSPAGLFRSEDRGETWQSIDAGPSGVDGVARLPGPATVFTAPTRWLAG